ncbi:MAG: hypothetical protein NVS3B12_26930 [Acidimicrobiales bacterium]
MSRRNTRGITTATTAAGLGIALAVAGGTAAGATTTVTTQRIAGADRYETAAKLATTSFGQRPSVILASGLNYPDALAAAYLAGHNATPVLLTDPANLSSAALGALQTLNPQAVQIIGGTAAVSDNVANQVRSNGYTVARIGGTDRYDTAAQVAQAPGADVVGTLGSFGKTAIVATGLNFADALAGGPVAYSAALPLLLTDPSTLPATTNSALDKLAIKHVVILGGTAAVGSTVEAALTAKGITVERLAGANRQATATTIANFEGSRLGFKLAHVNLARGDDFPDALAGGPHSGKESAPIVLTASPDTLSAETDAFLRANTATIASIDVFGGTNAISDATVAQAQKAAQNG